MCGSTIFENHKGGISTFRHRWNYRWRFVNLCATLTSYSDLIKHYDVKSPMTMVGDLTKADCPTIGHFMSNSHHSPTCAQGGNGEYIDRCIMYHMCEVRKCYIIMYLWDANYDNIQIPLLAKPSFRLCKRGQGG